MNCRSVRRFLMMMLSCGLLSLATAAQAAVIISIDTVSVPAGSTAVVGVYASSNSNDVISGFNLPLDINNNGFVDLNNDNLGDLPSGFTLSNPVILNPIYANTGFDRPFPQISLAQVDAIPTGSGANVTLGPQAIKLFDLSFNVAANVPAGTEMPLRIIIPASPLQSLFNVAGPNSPQIILPSVTAPANGLVRVIPEPASSMGMLLGVVGLVAGRRKRAI